MDVAVHFKPGHRWLRSLKTPSVLGGGLLVRARSTTLALLGVTAAVGLSMVALALNQSWPLVAGSPIPGISPRHEAVGEAKVAARAAADALVSESTRTRDAARPHSLHSAGRGDTGAGAPQVAPAPSGSAELVVAPSAPAEPQGDAPRGADDTAPAPSPAADPPGAPVTAASEPVPTQPESAPQAPPVVETTPPATSSETPVDSSTPPWSNGHGHAYGRDKSDYDNSAGTYDEDRDEDEDWDNEDGDHGHRWSGHHHDD